MAAPPVNPVSFKIKFPEFSAQDDGFIQLCIDEAGRNIDNTWLPGDQNTAWLYLSAHLVMVAVQRSQSGTGQIILSERIGELSRTYQAPPLPKTAETADDFYVTTPYGIRFLELARLNFPPVLVI